MVDLKQKTTLAFMTYIIELDACELHMGDEKVFNDIINEC